MPLGAGTKVVATTVCEPSGTTSVHDKLLKLMKKSDLLRALQTEIRKHNLTTFVDPKHRVTVPGCPTCHQAFGTVEQFVSHLTDDVPPGFVLIVKHSKILFHAAIASVMNAFDVGPNIAR